MKNVVFLHVMPCGSYKARVSEKLISSIFKVERICELGTLALISSWSTLRGNTNYMRNLQLLVS
jgi:hypothetical protein